MHACSYSDPGFSEKATQRSENLYLAVTNRGKRARFTQSKFRILHALCSASNLRARESKKNSVQAHSQGHVSH